ncbi:hypothetical protein [Pseudomonas sp. dw_358]|uniref:hypothetical protein n=1 Tax=Pseudomonas sp. dw_358 TaxID=2720083 RepID=UPI001BD344EE|nr:hypothetical protein [Pseudomonas sp. dw_358]
MNDSTPFKRTVVFVDGYSSREVILEAQLSTPLATESVFSAPLELIHAAAINVGDKEMTQMNVLPLRAL